MSKKIYTAEEKKAYHMGRAWAAGKKNKRVKCKTEKEKQSFRNGVNAVRGKKTANKKACSSCSYIVDGDGVILKVLDGGVK